MYIYTDKHDFIYTYLYTYIYDHMRIHICVYIYTYLCRFETKSMCINERKYVFKSIKICTCISKHMI